MTSIRWNNIVFGPIRSRRLGSSLGMNLMPIDGKICSFDCIYCECGWNKDGGKGSGIPSKEAVFMEMDEKFSLLKKEGTHIDTITFSGNGEPTIHPDFPAIIDYTLKLRDTFFPNAVISVLSNASMIWKKEIRDALMKVDNPILKIDSALEEYVHLIDNPAKGYSLDETIKHLMSFQGDFILQTMFLKGSINGHTIDCTDSLLTESWVKLVLQLRPREVMMYTIDRETPDHDLSKVTVEEMEKISVPLTDNGIKVQIRG